MRSISGTLGFVVLLTNAAATLFMTGLIWFVQVVHYPLFGGVGANEFAAYETRHSDLTTYVVIGPMFAELITAALLVWRRPAVPTWELWAGLGLVGIIWLSTALLQVPQHTTLTAGFDARAHGLLVSSNWIRTAAWTLRSLIVLRWLHRLMS